MELIRSAISLPVSDPARSHRFYTRVFGEPQCEHEGDTVSVTLPGVTVFFIAIEEFNLLLKPAVSEAEFATGKFTSMLSATVVSRDELYGSLKAAAEGGGTPCGQAVSYPWGMAAYFKDPDEHLWEILWREGR